jgi:hypothetical protein
VVGFAGGDILALPVALAFTAAIPAAFSFTEADLSVNTMFEELWFIIMLKM